MKAKKRKNLGLNQTEIEPYYRYRRGHGIESRSSLNFFQALISQLAKLCV